jgi:hypothetical protein
MFGLFKKRVTPSEFGCGILQLVADPLSSDGCRSLAARFPDFVATGGMATFLERKGLPLQTQKLYFRLFTHCAIQATTTRFDEGTRRAIVHGALVEGFANSPSDYDFGRTYTALEAAYRGEYKFHRDVESLYNFDAQVSWLPNPNAGVLNAKYLIESFVLPHMNNSKAFIDDFRGYSSTVCGTVGTIQRAIEYLLTSFKIS